MLTNHVLQLRLYTHFFNWDELNVVTVPTLEIDNVVIAPTFKMHNVGTVPNTSRKNIGKSKYGGKNFGHKFKSNNFLVPLTS